MSLYCSHWMFLSHSQNTQASDSRNHAVLITVLQIDQLKHCLYLSRDMKHSFSSASDRKRLYHNFSAPDPSTTLCADMLQNQELHKSSYEEDL